MAKDQHVQLTRRVFIVGLVAAGGLATTGCSRTEQAPSNTVGAGSLTPAATPASKMTVYRDPSCGCCEAWAALAREAGYQVELINHPDMASIKRRYGVPDKLTSCHTAVVGGYVVEGHVPLESVARLLREKPANLKGIAVPGMPLGSPGMEVPDGTRQPFTVMAFDANGRTSAYNG